MESARIILSGSSHEGFCGPICIGAMPVGTSVLLYIDVATTGIYLWFYIYTLTQAWPQKICVQRLTRPWVTMVTMYFHRTLYLCIKLYLFLLILCKMQLFKVSALTIFSYYYYFDYFSDTLRGSEIQTGFWMIASDTCRRKLLISFKYKFIVLYLFNF